MMAKRIMLLAVCTLTFSFMQAQWKHLFDGKSLRGWKQVGGEAIFEVEDGAIVGSTVANTGNSFIVTENEYSDFVLELEVKVDDTTNNAGIQTRSHFDENANNGAGKVYGRQVEIDPSSRAWSGGIYDEGRRDWLYPLSLNPKAQRAFKVGEYNKYRIECFGNETRTWVNGIPTAYVVDTIDDKGFIALQVHAINDTAHEGMKIFYRNIRLSTAKPKQPSFDKTVYVVNLQPNKLSAFEKSAGWKLLFNGTGSNGWKSARSEKFPEKGWSIEDGNLKVVASQGKESAYGGDIVTTGKYSAFDLSFSFKISPGGNSGVKYFVTLEEKTEGSAIGLEYQVLDDTLHPDAKLGINGNRTLGSLYDLIRADKQKRFINPPGEWNWGRVVVYPDNKVEHYLNGVKVLEYVRGSEHFRKLVANSKYRIWPGFGEAKEGHILLQDHGDEVWFRNIKIKELK